MVDEHDWHGEGDSMLESDQPGFHKSSDCFCGLKIEENKFF